MADGLTPRPGLEFPVEFPLKAIGTGSDDFEEFVLEIVRRHVPDLPEEASNTRLSGGGKYLAVTVTFVATSRAQLDALYRELSQHPRVVMLL
jgi:putative lipoic acid-binding regulatory protein